MQTLPRVIAGSVLAFVALAFAAGIFLAELALHPPRRALLAEDELRARKIADHNNSEFAEVSILTADGIVLRAWNMRPRISNGDAIILSHGISDNRSGMREYADMFLKHGYRVLMPDARAHGSSGAELATYGMRETNDLHLWFDWIDMNWHPLCIFGFAESIGAAVLLQSLQSESRFCAVVAESSFSNFREITYDRIGQFFHTGPWLGRTFLRPVVETAFSYAKWKYKLDFSQVSPEKAVASSKVPVLLIHGQIDRNIPVRHSRRIATGNSSVLLWEVPLADHCGAIGVAPTELERRVVGWFEQNNKRPRKPHV